METDLYPVKQREKKLNLSSNKKESGCVMIESLVSQLVIYGRVQMCWSTVKEGPTKNVSCSP